MKYFLPLLFIIACAAQPAAVTTTQENALDLGTFSLSLAVNDIQAAYAFYQQLGFEPVPNGGDLNQKWIILRNGSSKIGLFEGMFPSNTLTFNPADARALYRELAAQGTNFIMANGMEADSGPCSFMISDPDGNPILVDQY